MIKGKTYLAETALLAMSMLAARCAEAKYVVTFVESRSNVLETGRGTLDITDLTRATNVGAGDPTSATLSAGAPVGISGETSESVLVFPDYVSGAPLSESSVYLNATFASLGMTPGTYVWSWGSGDHADTFTINIGSVSSSVPEPSTWAMMLTGFAGLGFAGYRSTRRCAVGLRP